MKLLACCAPLLFCVATAMADDSTKRGDEIAKAWAAQHTAEIVELYKELHQAPELSFEEKETAARMAKELRALGAEVRTDIGGHGVIGILRNGEGNTLMLRADMDALPVAEETGVPYASKVVTTNERGQSVGVMHACGHDIHMSNMVGVARMLAENKDAWQGTAIFLMQPAEERGAGAKAMLDDGLLTMFPRPDYAVAVHVAADLEAGKVGYCPGYACANVDSVDILVKGRGGHGAYPETTVDPVVIAAKLVLDLQTIVSREIRPNDPAVITVGAIQGGTKHNVIGDECKLQLTVRSYSPEVRAKLAEAIIRKAKAAAMSAGAPEPEIDISEGTPSMYNDPELTQRVAAIATRVVGAERVEKTDPTMGGEDFSRYGLVGLPISMFKVGTVSAERMKEFKDANTPAPSLHSPLFYPEPEKTLETSLSTTGAVALELLSKP
ncbi:M20 metallopeptidase family protein [Aeoliella sp. SH292]|uniref:M20 metallopeptidase family protein n=1 Tax=Aeoliella sp. SH292 TaxID=3454464 RepID=UPI003F9E6B51